MPSGWTWPPSTAMKTAGQRCTATLDELGIEWHAAPAQRKIATPVVVPSMTFGGVVLTPIFRKPPFVMDCHLALALIRHAPKLRAAGIRELRFSSIFDFRRIRTRRKRGRPLSRHALGLAVDVYEMVKDNGEVLVVSDDYRQHRAFFKDVERALFPGRFRAVLTPGNDRRTHHDHFHLEAKMLREAPRKRDSDNRELLSWLTRLGATLLPPSVKL